MSVRRKVVQLSGALMILVMRSVVIASRHYRGLICPDLLWASMASL
jgi:hypothetical protein